MEMALLAIQAVQATPRHGPTYAITFSPGLGHNIEQMGVMLQQQT
jgi:hypothetical protein